MSVAAEYLSQPPDYPVLHKLTVKDYYRMGEVGILRPDERTELIEGKIFNMPPIGCKHADWVDRLAYFFIQSMPSEIRVRIQNPIRLDNFSEPQPDVTLLHPRQQPYSEAHPHPEDIALVVEVADSTLHFDRNVKLSLYAQHQIPEVWLLNVSANRLDIFQQPQNKQYNLHIKPEKNDKLKLVALDHIELDLQKLFQSK